jgi:hypothetical protein
MTMQDKFEMIVRVVNGVRIGIFESAPRCGYKDCPNSAYWEIFVEKHDRSPRMNATMDSPYQQDRASIQKSAHTCRKHVPKMTAKLLKVAKKLNAGTLAALADLDFKK